MEVRKLRSPQAAARLKASRADAPVSRQGRHASISAREDPTDAIIETITDDMRRDIVRGAPFQQRYQAFVDFYLIK
jgi:hypothetical protein